MRLGGGQNAQVSDDAQTTVDAASALFEKGIKARVLSMHTLKPIDKKAILDAARETGGILTIEEHSHIGGLGGAGKDRCRRSEIRGQEGTEVRRQRSIRRLRRLHGLGKKVCFKRVALPSEFTRHVGNQDYLRGIYGLTVDGIVENTIALLKRRISHRPTRTHTDKE